MLHTPPVFIVLNEPSHTFDSPHTTDQTTSFTQKNELHTKEKKLSDKEISPKSIEFFKEKLKSFPHNQNTIDLAVLWKFTKHLNTKRKQSNYEKKISHNLDHFIIAMMEQIACFKSMTMFLSELIKLQQETEDPNLKKSIEKIETQIQNVEKFKNYNIPQALIYAPLKDHLNKDPQQAIPKTINQTLENAEEITQEYKQKHKQLKNKAESVIQNILILEEEYNIKQELSDNELKELSRSFIFQLSKKDKAYVCNLSVFLISSTKIKDAKHFEEHQDPNYFIYSTIKNILHEILPSVNNNDLLLPKGTIEIMRKITQQEAQIKSPQSPNLKKKTIRKLNF